MVDKARDIISILEEHYPIVEQGLESDSAWQLLFSARLAAQCTDKRVNIVSKELYSRYPDLEQLASADIDELENIIRSTGFFRVKARDLKNGAAMLLYKHNGVVPSSMEELLELPGVGRKIANLIRGDIYGLPAIVADTHCIRLSNRLGLCDTKNPHKVEKCLAVIIPEDKQNDFCHRLVFHGRAVCKARSPLCASCDLYPLCDRVGL